MWTATLQLLTEHTTAAYFVGIAIIVMVVIFAAVLCEPTDDDHHWGEP